jgi:hypothetical protein
MAPKRKQRRARCAPSPSGDTEPRICQREIHKRLVPHVKEHFDHALAAGVAAGRPWSDCVEAALNAGRERYSRHWLAATLDLQEPASDNSEVRMLRAFRDNGGSLPVAWPSTVEASFPLFLGPPPSHHPYPAAFIDCLMTLTRNGAVVYVGNDACDLEEVLQVGDTLSRSNGERIICVSIAPKASGAAGDHGCQVMPFMGEGRRLSD